MKRILRNAALALAIAPFLSNCASQDEVKRLQYQLHVMNKRLEDMKSTTVGDIQKRQAASSSQIDQLEREILGLKGQLEETTRQNEVLTAKNTNLEQNITDIARVEAEKREEALRQIQLEQQQKEQRIAELNDKIRIQQENLQAIQNARVQEAERRAKEAKLKAEAAKARAQAASTTASRGSVFSISADKKKRVFNTSVSPAVTSPQAPTAGDKSSPAPQKVVEKPASTTQKKVEQVQEKTPAKGSPLQAGQDLFNQKQYKNAYSEFSKVASGNNDTETVVEASFMMGESLFAQKEYDKAILQYQKIISQHASSPRAASATLKQAMAFELLADKETAKMIYKKIITHYGSSPEAGIAKDKLSKM